MGRLALTRTLFMQTITSVSEVVKVVDIFRFYCSHFISVSHNKFNIREFLVSLDKLIHDLTVIRDDVQIARDAIADMFPESRPSSLFLLKRVQQFKVLLISRRARCNSRKPVVLSP